MQLEPFEKYTLFRGLENHLDSTTYYVQVVIRNGKTAALIDTVNLTDNGNREFSKEWEVPADVNGTGFYITLTYSVYTDSGYTTKSENYGDKYEEHLVQHRITDTHSAGPDINYKKIQQMIDAAVAGIKFPMPEKIDLKPVLKAIKDIPQTEIPDQKEVDLMPVMQELNNLKLGVADLMRRQPFEKTDLTPLIIDLQTIKEFLVNEKNDDRKKEILDAISKQGSNLSEWVTEFDNKIKPTMDLIESLYKLFSRVQLPTETKDFISLANEQARKAKNEKN